MGGRSRAAAQLLSGQGFKDVYNLTGGMNAWQGLTAFGAPEMGMVPLTGEEAPTEIAVMAYGLEQGLADFYSKVAAASHESEVVDLLRKLAGIEETHKEKVFDLYRAIDPAVTDKKTFESQTVSEMMEGGFTTEEFLEQHGEFMKTVDGVLNIAMMLETQGLDLYMRYAQRSEDQKSRQVLFEIAEDEKAHLDALGRLMESKTKEAKNGKRYES
jgi:rubrerythrin